jgi:hypothetical protein
MTIIGTQTKTRFIFPFMLLFFHFCHPAKAQISQIMLAGKAGSAVTPIGLLTHTEADTSSGNGVTTSAIDTTGATFLAMAIGSNSNGGNGAPGGISDSKGNTWTCGTATATGAPGVFGAQMQICYAWNPTVGTGHTFTYTFTGGGMSIAVAAFSNVKTVSTPYDQENEASTSPTDVTVSTGSITPSANNELILTATSLYFTGETTPSSFTLIDSSVFPGGTYNGVALAYKVQTTAGAENATWTGDGNNSYRAAVIASIKHN